MSTPIQDQLKSALPEAMKAKDKARTQTIRGLLSALQYERLQQKVDTLNDSDCLQILQRELKKRHETLDFAKQDNRQDTIASVEMEIKLIESFLPKQLSENEIENILTVWQADGSASNLGEAMKKLKGEHGGSYNGKLASEVAKKLFT